MTHHEATSRDWLNILGLGGLVLAIGIVIGAVGATLKHTSFRSPAGLSNSKSDLAGDYIEVAVTEPPWETQVTPVLPPPTTSSERDVLIVAVDSAGKLRYLVARLDMMNPDLSSIRIYLVNVTVTSRTTVKAEFVGEVSGHYYYFSTNNKCFEEIPHHGIANPVSGCIN